MRMATSVRSAFLLYVIAALVAMWLQDHSGLLPLGLFNEGRRQYEWISAACLIVFAGFAVLFVAELMRRRPIPPAPALRGLIVSFLLLELLLLAADLTLVSRGASARLGGPYRELESASGDWIYLKKAHGGSPYGFRTSSPYPKRADRLRLLFLGDSYTEGSGRSAACNYPDVATRRLSERLGVSIEAMNAGVAGYGPVDAARLLQHLVAEGYHFDAVVYGLFLENDFTDNLPGTDRRVVAGMNFRFPASRFLRVFHPLNSRTFRYALFVARASRFDRGNREQVRREEGQCRLEGKRLRELSDGLRSLVERRLDANYAPHGTLLASGEVSEALTRLAAATRRLRIPLAIVVFPDRILVDADLERLLGRDLAAEGYDLQRLRRWIRGNVQGALLLDTTPVLAGGSEHYRKGDTHLSDLGNRVVGEWVGDALAERLPNLAETQRR
jgi:hypothetical protein